MRIQAWPVAVLTVLAVAGCSSVESTVPPSPVLPSPSISSTTSSANASAPARTATAPPATEPLPAVPATSRGCAKGGQGFPTGTTIHNPAAEPQRRYLVHVPPSYDPAVPAPMIVTMHGLGSNAPQQLGLTGIEAAADNTGYVVVAPEALGGKWALPTDETTAETAETGYLEAVMSEVGAALCLDPTRYYASGMSMGSAMTFVLACQPERRFAAFGGVGATFYRPACDRTPPAPIIYFHGTADQVVPYLGGIARGFAVQPVETVMADWAAHNSCAVGPDPATSADITTFSWTSCAQNASVDFYRVDGGGHTWPGTSPELAKLMAANLGATTQSVAATTLMLAFFANYRLPAEP